MDHINTIVDHTALQNIVLECVGFPKMYYCGFDCCLERDGFNTWKKIQQHYKLFHQISIKKSQDWEATAVPKVKEVEIYSDSIELPTPKRKRSTRSNPIRKELETNSVPLPPLIDPVTPALADGPYQLLQSCTLLAKVNDDPELLKDQIQKLVHEESNPSAVLKFVDELIEGYTEKKSIYENSIEACKANCGALDTTQIDILERIKFLNLKQLYTNIEYTKALLYTLEMHQSILKNPEYIALLQLQILLK